MQEDVVEAELVLVGVVAEVFQLGVVAEWEVDSVEEGVLEVRLAALHGQLEAGV